MFCVFDPCVLNLAASKHALPKELKRKFREDLWMNRKRGKRRFRLAAGMAFGQNQASSINFVSRFLAFVFFLREPVATKLRPRLEIMTIEFC